jgi:3-hydroxyisobutyrate dehydrogenase-like beta-hydroxyacid dehydrogenase
VYVNCSTVSPALNGELPEAETVKRLYHKAAAAGLDHADVAAVTELYWRPAAAIP